MINTHSILVIEDDETDYDIVRRNFSKVAGHAFEIFHCVNVEDAIDLLSKKSIDLVLLDNHLGPEIDIRASLPRLRKAGYTNPIGILSSDVENETVEQFDSLGGDFRMSKDELDPKAIQFFLNELSKSALPNDCDEDYS
ncbi:Response regulator of citrate/malate metabolism [Hoeflea phototrophica DFL-43]|jgi:DNA-binding response OmpR family regulator|uniref:Response regulator of citrate/malate metabolism n=1 Tax=Hoeflea phototrophica (strain DSM 17068 / NCIMB 14078 / DFL-43) TaxID=411684 RepID=A9DDZ9_HOEPD|nr:response regulator [Hoeflea phototrophica]EDQ31937.1 Response regulator of citrate/malate metabolism [Hoeflea phototrophica DFL-43]